MTQKTVPPEIRPGIKGEAEVLVCEHNVAPHVQKFSTPSLVLLMEHACVNAIHPRLNADQTSVGYEVFVRHLAPTPIGMKVRAQAELVEVQGNRLLFRVEAYDEAKKIGEGTHRRAVVGKSFG
jgi:predicted thioesterase